VRDEVLATATGSSMCALGKHLPLDSMFLAEVTGADRNVSWNDRSTAQDVPGIGRLQSPVSIGGESVELNGVQLGVRRNHLAAYGAVRHND
jgi:hypothetical protein